MQRLTLPKTLPVRNWLRSTEALRAHLQVRLSSVKTRADAKRREADEIEREVEGIEQTLAFINQLLLPKKIGTSEADLPLGVRLGLSPAQTPALTSAGEPAAGSIRKRWALMYDACVDCGRTDRRHAAMGRCQTCHYRFTHNGDRVGAPNGTDP